MTTPDLPPRGGLNEDEMSKPGRVCINRRWWERDVVEGVWISDGGLDSPDVDDWPAACRQIADLTRELEAARAENARLREALDVARAAAGVGLSIPYYAYGDHEAACALADALNNTAAELDRVIAEGEE